MLNLPLHNYAHTPVKSQLCRTCRSCGHCIEVVLKYRTFGMILDKGGIADPFVLSLSITNWPISTLLSETSPSPPSLPPPPKKELYERIDVTCDLKIGLKASGCTLFSFHGSVSISKINWFPTEIQRETKENLRHSTFTPLFLGFSQTSAYIRTELR